MIFNEETHKVEIDSLNSEEAQSYISFLEIEIRRHSACISVAIINMENKSTQEFWGSAVKRHESDLAEIKELIERVKDKYERQTS